jgi:MFS superfamily sulfate permease-like transporter
MDYTSFIGKSSKIVKSYFPIPDWGAKYTGKTFANDMIVALIVIMMLIPPSLAYAILAGLPPEVGLYASMAPLLLYAIFGSSRALAVGPVAVASLMTAAAAGQLASQRTPEYLVAAVALAMVSGLLLAMGFLKLGFLANFLSHTVIAGFITPRDFRSQQDQTKKLKTMDSKEMQVAATDNYNLYFRFAGQYLPGGFSMISSTNPLILKIEERTEANTPVINV